jgi:hypothetical protein
MGILTKEIELFAVYMAAGIIWYDKDIKRYIGRGADMFFVDLGGTKEDVIARLKTHPEPTNW